MYAEVKCFHSPDIDLVNYWPQDENNFSFLLEISAGPVGEATTQVFQLNVISLQAMSKLLEAQGHIWGNSYLVVIDYNINFIKSAIERRINRLHGANWVDLSQEIAEFTSRGY